MDTTHQMMTVTGDATASLPVGEDRRPITVVGSAAIREGFGGQTLQQAIDCRLAPGVTDVILNPDAHVGYGAPVGCVMVSPTHLYPGPVGVDIKCSMSLLQTDVPAGAVTDRNRYCENWASPSRGLNVARTHFIRLPVAEMPICAAGWNA